MNLIIEIIDGVAYAVEKTNNCIKACKRCVFVNCDIWCVKRHSPKTYYRRLTAEEREELIKAIGRGME